VLSDRVTGSSFFGVSGEDGSFQIEGLPPGEYTIVAWHEDFGAKIGKAKVDANRTATSPTTAQSLRP